MTCTLSVYLLLAWPSLSTLPLVACVTALEQARGLISPSPNRTHKGEVEGEEFFVEHEVLLEQARLELGPRHAVVYNPSLGDIFRQDVLEALSSGEEAGAGLWALVDETEVPGVYGMDLLSHQFLKLLSEELEHLRQSGIPLRRPNGMNRFGCILDDLGFGGLTTVIADSIVRPLAMRAYPDWVRGEDMVESYLFSVRYEEGGDLALAEHADASCVTLNICTDGSFQGGELAFKGVRFKDNDAATREEIYVTQRFGRALLHMGQHFHRATPIRSGARTNVVLWLMGQHGVVRAVPYASDERDVGWVAAGREL